MRWSLATGALAVASGLLASAQTPATSPQQSDQVFRGGTTLIPVDVRVIDRDGKPVTDLTQADFIVTENGVRQQIRHFSKSALVADTSPDALAPARAAAPAAAGDLAPQNRRLFLIVLGRGRLQPPAKGVDGMIHFVQERLLPQDQVAILAWNRATEFTTDHAGAVELLQRFKKAHEGIEAKLGMRFQGLAALYGGNRIPDAIQREINAVFGGAGVRTVAAGLSPNASRMADDVRRDTDLLLNPSNSTIDQAQADALGMSFDEYISANARSSQDLGKLYLGVEYLRHLDGEKHLVFVSEQGLQLPRVEDDRDLAAAATDARVVIDYVHTGGVGGVTGGGIGIAEARGRMAAPPPARISLGPSMIARTLAERTGGSYYANRFRNAAEDMDHVDQATRFGYLLGYYPTRALDGKYREIRVQVTRPGLTVLYRHGYFATPEIAPFNRQRILTYGRVTSAAGFVDEIHDIGLRVSAAASPEVKNQPREIAVTSTVDIGRIKFNRNGPLRVATIEVAVFVVDGSDKQLGLSWKTVELTFSDDRYQQALKAGVPIPITLQVTGKPKNVKVVVYDYGADLVGSVVAKVM